MNTKKWNKYLLIGGIILTGFFIWRSTIGRPSARTIVEIIKPTRGDIEVVISTTGAVQPQNRLEMKPPISGRVEEILVREGQPVKKGEIIAWMSSTERAALLDAARSKGEDSIAYWEQAYKPTPLIAPIDGDVIVRAVEPGQTVTSADPIVVLSDRLIVKAQVDETDIGRVEVGQRASLSLDAYPKEVVKAAVDHISYESKLVNNVTIYEVDILPAAVPSIFRSGMTANVNIVQERAENVLRLPVEAIRREKKDSFVLVKGEGFKSDELREVETGLENEDHVEIRSGLKEGESVLIETRVLPSRRTGGNNPFMPSRNRNR